MGLFDTLAESRDARMSTLGSLFGGQTAESRLRTFAERDFPAIAQEFANATTEQGINRAMDLFAQKSMQAGLKPEQMRELAKHLVEPALRNVGANEIGKITGELQGQPAQPRPEGMEGPLTEKGAFIEARPGRNPTAADMFKMAEIEARTGVKAPQGFAAMVSAPAQIAEREANAKMREESQRKTAAELAGIQAKQKTIESLPDKPIGDTGVSPRALGQVGGLGQFVTQSMPQRGDPLDADRRALIAAQTEAARARTGEASRGGRGSQIMQDFVRQGGDPSDIDAFMNYAERRSGATARGTETVFEGALKPGDQALIENEIATLAVMRKKTDSESIKKIASDMGYEIEGKPGVQEQGAALNPWGAKANTLTGDFRLRRKPTTRTTTRTPQGGAKQPAKSTSKRIRFDAQGNQIAD